METRPTMIAVGVDSSPEALAAARFGARAAELRGLDLLLCHAVSPPATTESSAWLIERLQGQLRVPPTMVVSTLLDQLSPAVLLKEVEDAAAMLVVGHRRLDRPEHSILGGLAAQLVASVHRPLAVVPAGWVPRPWTSRPVLVAVDPTTEAPEVLTFACEEAVRLQAPLVAAYALPAGRRRDADLALLAVQEALAGSKQDHPDLSIAVELLTGAPEHAVVEASRQAGQLVLGGPRHPRRPGGWSGSVARTAVRWAHCPVVVVPRADS